MKKVNWKISTLWFLISYYCCFAIITLHTIIVIQKMGSIESYYPAYVKTFPFHPLYCIIIWSVFAFLYYRMAKTEKKQRKTALYLGSIWSISIVVLDLIGWVIIQHPYTLSFYEFYVEAQPWITMVYIAIFASPFVGMFLYDKVPVKKKN